MAMLTYTDFNLPIFLGVTHRYSLMDSGVDIFLLSQRESSEVVFISISSNTYNK